MKVAITGHSKGIGAAIANALTRQGHTVTGYDITNNYDISKPGVIEAIAAECTDYDIFINNAYADTAQTKMLETMIDAWLDRDKLIVNISSKMVFVKSNLSEQLMIYKHNKLMQNKIVKSRITTSKPHILNIITGFVNTDLAVSWQNSSKIDPVEFAKLVVSLIALRGQIQVQEIILDAVPNSNQEITQ